jgi:hypothetical protein
MRRSLRPAFLVAALLLATVPVAADSFVEGSISGLELCPQSICTLAIFVGEFEGTVSGRPRQGVFLAGINHEPDLPDENGESIAITGGTFVIRLPFHTIRGVVVPEGSLLTSNGDNTFDVEMNLLIAGPGGIALPETFLGLLRHDVFPPTIEGTIQ